MSVKGLSASVDSRIQVWTDVTLGAGDSVSVFRTDDGGTEEVAVQENGAPVFLSTSRTSVMLNGPAVYRLKRSAVSAAVTVYYDE